MDDYKKMINIALNNLDNAYAPYSHFKVSAVVLMSSGKMYNGVNVESSTFTVGTCAERNALFHAIAEGEKEVKAVAVVGGPNGIIRDYCVPCGACRQMLREFCDPKACDVIIAKTTDDYIIKTLDELLPDSFDSNFLKEV